MASPAAVITLPSALLETVQCLLQQVPYVIIVPLFALLVQLYKKIGSGLQCLVDCAGVLAVRCNSLKPLYEPVEECERLAVDIFNCHSCILLLCHINLFIREISLWHALVGC